MASGETTIYDIPFPLPSDPVNVAGDIQSLAERIEVILPSIGLPYHTIEITNNSGVSINAKDPVYISGYNSTTNKPTVARSDADDLSTLPVIGLAQTNIGTNSDGVVVISGVFTDVDTSSYSAGDLLYINSGGGLTTTQPVSGSGVVGVVAKSNINGVILVGAFKGNGTWGSMKAGLA